MLDCNVFCDILVALVAFVICSFEMTHLVHMQNKITNML